jgi:glucose/arabinose dehydrogenase
MNRVLCACLLAASGSIASAQLTTQEITSVGNRVDRPVFVTHAGDGSGRLFVIEQEGAIRIIDAGGNLLPTPFLDIDPIVTGGNSGGDERGLLGLAFHPDYANNGKFYVNYTGSGGDTRIAEYQVSAGDPDIADPGTARIIMFYDQPFTNHNGGWVSFGPDGYLYIAAGDGGSGNDPGNRAARLNQFLGKMHRIDVDGGDDFPADNNQNYEIPADNPFVDEVKFPNAVKSIWHYGLRNPWRTSFDRDTGDMWIADVGQNAFEEINHNVGNVGGNNYGWRCREAFQSTGLSCGATGWTDPVFSYPLTGGNCAIIGGYVYRGCELGEAFQGQYFFGDYCGGSIWNLDPTNHTRTTQFNFGFGLSSFGEDESGELYITDVQSGQVFKIINPSAPDDNKNGVPDACEAMCPADLTGDGLLNFFDISAFLNAFNAQDPIADFTGDGSFNFFDVSAFLNAFNAGCP